MSLVWNNARLIRGKSDDDDICALVNELRDKLTVLEAVVPSIFTAVAQGEVPASGGGAVNFLRADGTWSAPPVSDPQRVFLGERTGTGPWTWSGLTGDETGLRGYAIVCQFTKAAAGGYEPRIQFNGDTGANYADGSGVAATSARLGTTPDFDLGDFNAVAGGEVLIASARSGAYRCLTGQVTCQDDAPFARANVPDSSWRSTAQITSISVIMASGSVDSGVLALYKLMDVP